MRISDWSSDVCSSDLQIGQLGARAVRGEPIFGAQEIVERTALRVRKQRLGLCPALAADCGENLRVELFFLARKNVGHRLRRNDGAGVSGIDRARRRRGGGGEKERGGERRSEEHTSELPSLMRISYAVFCLKKKK